MKTDAFNMALTHISIIFKIALSCSPL